SVAGMSTPADVLLTNAAGAAASITATSGTPQSATINTAFAAPLVATVKDAGGNPVAGVTVTFGVPGSGASGSFAGGVNTATTNGRGRERTRMNSSHLGASYADTVLTSVTGVATPADFSLTSTARAVDSIPTRRSSDLSATINTAFAAPLVATVKDAGGNPVAGVTVTFGAPGSGASGSFAGGVNTATTNGSGVATSATFTANNVAGGPYKIGRASCRERGYSAGGAG